MEKSNENENAVEINTDETGTRTRTLNDSLDIAIPSRNKPLNESKDK